MEIIFIVLVAVVIITVIFLTQGMRETKINEKIESMGGKVICIERRNFFTGLGPFMVVGKGRSVYRIEYEIHNQTKEGWVRFGGLLGPDWRL